MPVFDDLRSLGHFVAGLVAAMNPLTAVGVTLLFILYQQGEKEEELNKHGDYIEFLLGFSLGLALRSR